VIKLFARLRHASVWELSISALLAIAASVVLDRVGAPGSAFLVALLFGFGAGVGFMALAVWQMRRAQ
jgi:hypothetical protein